MNFYYNIFILFFLILSYSFSKVEIIEPYSNQIFCNDKEINFVLNQNSSNYDIIAYIHNLDGNINLVNIVKSDNTLSWFPNDSTLYGQLINFKIYNKFDSEDFAILSDIIINKKIEIIDQTKSVLICEGEEILLSIEAIGNNCQYQWYKDDKLISGAISSIYYIKSGEYENSGSYTCKVSDDSQCSAVESAPIGVYVATKTQFTSKMKNFQFDQNELIEKKPVSARLVANVHINDNVASDQIKFEWWKDTIGIIELNTANLAYIVKAGRTQKVKLENGGRYSGANSDVLTISNLNWDDRTNYYCIVTGMCGSDISQCYIGKNTLFTVKNDIKEFEGCDKQDVSFRVKVELKDDVKGELSYKWYKSGKGFLVESEKYVGTNSPKLIIKRVDSKEDIGIFFCQVSILSENVSQLSDEFLLFASEIPKIRIQPVSISILDTDRPNSNQTFIQVLTENPIGSLYTWYRNGELARKECWKSDYWLGIDSCPPVFPPPPFRDPKPEDVGWYRCRIRNECGITWSDSAYISWGFDPIRLCEGEDAHLKVSDLGDDYTYQWVKAGEILEDNLKYQGTQSYELIINTTTTQDNGKYICTATNIKDSSSVQLGNTYLAVNIKPTIFTDLPNELKNDGLKMPYAYFVVNYRARKYWYKIYRDGEVIEEKEVDLKNTDDKETMASWVIAFKNKNDKPGIYQIYFKTDCGELWSNKVTVINTEYVETGSVPDNNDDGSGIVSNIDLQDVNQNHNQDLDFMIYPNPSYNSINIFSLNSATIPSEDIQIYNSIGLQVNNFEITNNNQNSLEINISKLNSGMYFIRIGNKLDKFIKID